MCSLKKKKNPSYILRLGIRYITHYKITNHIQSYEYLYAANVSRIYLKSEKNMKILWKYIYLHTCFNVPNFRYANWRRCHHVRAEHQLFVRSQNGTHTIIINTTQNNDFFFFKFFFLPFCLITFIHIFTRHFTYYRH